MSGPPSVRIDVWLWRARFFRTRSLAQDFVEQGRVRLTHAGRETRLDKASRLAHPGDLVVFATGGRVTAVRVVALGERRGSAAEARGLYADVAVAPDNAVADEGAG
jgi:ribosome-associated heat shock protein Hsp15